MPKDYPFDKNLLSVFLYNNIFCDSLYDMKYALSHKMAHILCYHISPKSKAMQNSIKLSNYAAFKVSALTKKLQKCVFSNANILYCATPLLL